MNKSTEPAIKSYFFGKGYRDLVAVIKESWNLNLKSAKDFFARAKTSSDAGSIFWRGAGISVIVFGMLFFVAISLLHILLLGLFFLLIYISFTIVWGIERTYLFFQGFSSTCPHCHEKTTLPEYMCNNCGAIHTKLVPNNYGILFHQCQCGQKLPATFFLNRGELQARCQTCHQLLHRDHIESRKIFIPILGGSSVGKTAFMFAVVRKLVEEKAAEMGFETAFVDSNTKSEYRKIVNQLRNGNVPAKTLASIPKAFNLALQKDGETKWFMYIYDPAGEAFEDTENLAVHRYYEFLSGIVMIIDPFSIPAVKRDYENELSRTGANVNPSQLNVEDALARVLLTLEESFDLSKTGKINKRLAVVISKVDAFGLEKIIGEEAVDKAMKTKMSSDRAKIRNDLIRQQLIDWNEDALVHQLDTRFKHVRFFSCSALGRIPDSTSNDFVPHHVFEPISWILNSVIFKQSDSKKPALEILTHFGNFARQYGYYLMIVAILIPVIFYGIWYGILSSPNDNTQPPLSTPEMQQDNTKPLLSMPEVQPLPEESQTIPPTTPHQAVIYQKEVIYQENEPFHLGDEEITSSGWKTLHGNCFTATFYVNRPIQTLILKLDIWNSDSRSNAILLNENKVDTLPYKKPSTKKWIKTQVVLPTNQLQQNVDNQLQICSGVTTEGDKDDLQIRKIELIAK
jgi:hypothetical protein